MRGLPQVTTALRGYADRGVFSGFSVQAGSRARHEFAFTWLTRAPMRLRYEASTGTLRFVDLFPGAALFPGMAQQLRRLVLEHHSKQVPEHRRIDRRRVRLGCTVRAGNFSLVLAVRGAQHAYAVQRGLNLVNQLFLLLQSEYPEYLIECFGFSQE